MEVVKMRLVLFAVLVPQNLEPLPIFHGNGRILGYARLNARYYFVLAPLQESTGARPHPVPAAYFASRGILLSFAGDCLMSFSALYSSLPLLFSAFFLFPGLCSSFFHILRVPFLRQLLPVNGKKAAAQSWPEAFTLKPSKTP